MQLSSLQIRNLRLKIRIYQNFRNKQKIDFWDNRPRRYPTSCFSGVRLLKVVNNLGGSSSLVSKIVHQKTEKSPSVSVCEFERLREDIVFSPTDRRDLRKKLQKFSNLSNPAEIISVQTKSPCRQKLVKTKSLPLFLAEQWLLKGGSGLSRTPSPQNTV